MKKFVALLLCLLCCAPVLACADKTEEQDELTLVYDFETSVRPVGMGSGFGRININTEKEYVSGGKKSLKLNPMGKGTAKPYMLLPFLGEPLTCNYSDVTMLDEVQLKVNAPEDMNMYVGLYFSVKGELKSPSKTVELKKGWNDVVYKPDYSLTAISYNLKECNGLYLQFEQFDECNSPDVYVDDVKVKLRETPVEYENLISIKKTADYIEICDFEKVYQSVVFTPKYNTVVPTPSVEVVNAADYGLTAPSGKKVLRLEVYPKSDSSTSWTQMYMSEQVLKALDLSSLKDEIDNYVIKLDLYQKAGKALLLEINAYNSKKGMDWAGVTSQPDKWVTMEKPLSDLNKNGFISDPDSFAFAWLDLHSGEDNGEYFIDNIRIEKVN